METEREKLKERVEGRNPLLRQKKESSPDQASAFGELDKTAELPGY